jgi:hypothetical protein
MGHDHRIVRPRVVGLHRSFNNQWGQYSRGEIGAAMCDQRQVLRTTAAESSYATYESLASEREEQRARFYCGTPEELQGDIIEPHRGKPLSPTFRLPSGVRQDRTHPSGTAFRPSPASHPADVLMVRR